MQIQTEDEAPHLVALAKGENKLWPTAAFSPRAYNLVQQSRPKTANPERLGTSSTTSWSSR
mgnify:FL=1